MMGTFCIAMNQNNKTDSDMPINIETYPTINIWMFSRSCCGELLINIHIVPKTLSIKVLRFCYPVNILTPAILVDQRKCDVWFLKRIPNTDKFYPYQSLVFICQMAFCAQI